MAPVKRIDELKEYQNFLEKAERWVFIVTGMEGIGKSDLLAQMQNQHGDIPEVFYLDLARKSLREDRLSVLEELSRITSKYCDQGKSERFQQQLNEARVQILEATRSAQYIKQYIALQDNANLEGANMDLTVQSKVEAAETQAVALASSAFYEQLASFKGERIIILLDSCERLSGADEGGLGKWLLDDVVATLHDRLAQQKKPRQCFVVMASRKRLPLEVIKGPDQHLLLLSMFTEAVVYDYLQRADIDETLHSHIYTMTHGHALCLAIITDICTQDGSERADLATLAARFYERVWSELVEGRMLKYLRPPFHDLIRYGAIIEAFDLPTLSAVFSKLLGNFDPRHIYEELKLHPSVISLDTHDRYAFHPLLRSIVGWYLKKEEPREWKYYTVCYEEYSKQFGEPLPALNSTKVLGRKSVTYLLKKFLLKIGIKKNRSRFS